MVTEKYELGNPRISAEFEPDAGRIPQLWSNTSASGLRFESSLKASRLIGLHFGNIVAAAFSAGLLIPWAVIRTLRYRLDNFAGVIDDDVDTLVALGIAYRSVGQSADSDQAFAEARALEPNYPGLPAATTATK